MLKGDFTIPGESGYEELTLRLAKKWGADSVRDSDGTELSKDILDAGYSVYSTVCVIRGHNDWAKNHPEAWQQTFLMSEPVVAEGTEVEVPLMEGYFSEQFRIYDSPEALEWWQVFDRTDNCEIPAEKWSYRAGKGVVCIHGIDPWHTYTVNFLALRMWEEISMYNHVTNHWDSEHLVPIEPMHSSAAEYLLGWMDEWCRLHPVTSIVRFTSLFYNFAWIWGADESNRYRFTDWGSYDFTVSLPALKGFEAKYGWRMTSEDFINQGKLHSTHMPPDEKKRLWMDYINEFVTSLGRQLVNIVHSYGKKAYVFYDDSWIGIEPYGTRFTQIGFDGIIKCVFSGYETRMCAGVCTNIHEIRLHPYLFPVGLGGKPTFMEGGAPAEEALRYWVNIRRALLRQGVDRIGLGGYLHLTEDFPDFQDCIEKIGNEFRIIKQAHKECCPFTENNHVAVLHSWGALRPWTLSGHFHETFMHDLIHVMEALSGMAIKVSFIDFQDVVSKPLDRYHVIINAGCANDAWSGGKGWTSEVIEKLTGWVYNGGTFIGINEPSARSGYSHYFGMAHVLGVDMDPGDYVSHGKIAPKISEEKELETMGINLQWCWQMTDKSHVREKEGLFLTNKKTKVLALKNGKLAAALNSFGDGMGVYLSSFFYSPEQIRLLQTLIMKQSMIWTDNINIEAAWFPESRKLFVVNNSGSIQKTVIRCGDKSLRFTLKPYEMDLTTIENNIVEENHEKPFAAVGCLECE
jgi:1,3-beta-galactosyl-N-acetylhexosamine phosphorylase